MILSRRHIILMAISMSCLKISAKNKVFGSSNLEKTPIEGLESPSSRAEKTSLQLLSSSPLLARVPSCRSISIHCCTKTVNLIYVAMLSSPLTAVLLRPTGTNKDTSVPVASSSTTTPKTFTATSQTTLSKKSTRTTVSTSSATNFLSLTYRPF
jgi:hypothetical protein